MNFKYCPQCGREGTVTNDNSTNYQCSRCGFQFWNNPKSAAAVIFLNDQGEILFAERAIEPDKGKYDFPGGFLDYGEDPFAAAVREVHEETGALIAAEDLTLLGAYTLEYIPGVTVVDLVMVVRKWQGDMKAADDVAALEWKPRSFMKDSRFRPDYPGLEQKIDVYLSA